MSAAIARYLNPWKTKREERERRVAELRARDGDSCARCRRPMRFDLPEGHDQGPRIEDVVTVPAGAVAEPDNQCLCHGRCIAVGADHTSEVLERMRRHNEAELFAAARKRA